ncbi:MAG: GAF domain-containing protein [Rhodospirillales bacterium]
MVAAQPSPMPTIADSAPAMTGGGGGLERAEMLLAVANRLAATLSLDDVLETLIDLATGAIDAERGSLFLYDAHTEELYARVAQGNIRREIRFLGSEGIAGHVFNTTRGAIVDDAYADPRFNPAIDGQTGFVTRSILCAPVRSVTGEVIGVAQCLNKRRGRFSEQDLRLLEEICTQAAAALRNGQLVDRMRLSRQQELEFLDVVADITSEIDLPSLLQKVMSEATRMLNAERSTLFLNDDKNGELWSQVGEGLGTSEIRMPNTVGIAGHVYQTGETVNIPYAYADLRFNPAFDRETGFFTRSILCVPVVNKSGKTIGVTQVLNKIGGPFTREDESRLKAFTAQVSIALENARLFSDVQSIKNYTESMLQSMSNGVLSLDEDGVIVTCNAAGLRILQRRGSDVVGQPADRFFVGPNGWILDRVRRVADSRVADISMDAELSFKGKVFSVNVTVLPLVGCEQTQIGTMIIVEDITSEKRVKSTMARYIDPLLADQLLERGEEILGGKSTLATVLFSDIRGFTALTEELGPQATVSLLNEYFTVMVDCLQREGGMLDKFIGDAMMAAFGIPIANGDDEDRAVRAAISMVTELARWNDQRRERGLPAIDMGIGLNTAEIVSGNIGSPKRMDYTVIGDGVNLAARLESACKLYHAKILISENTLRRLRGTYRIRAVDRVVVKGRKEPVGLYEVLDHHSDLGFPNMARAIGHHDEGLRLYRRGRFADAIAAFGAALDLNGCDRLPRLYIDRCRRLLAEPPGDGWDGVWVLTEK